MMRDSPRRSPESSRRRKKDQRRASRDRLTFVPPQPMTTNMPTGSNSEYYSQHPTPTATTRTRDSDAPQTVRDRDGTRERDRGHEREWGRTPATRPRAASDSSGSFSSSSTDSSLLDISRHYPAQSRFGGVLGTFFKAPSERRIRRRRSGRASKRRVLYFGNSSSSSVNSDMAYGTGFVTRRKSREFTSRNPSGTYVNHDTRDKERKNSNTYERNAATASSSKQSGSKRDKTDEEILALGRQFSDFARKQNEHDLRASGKMKASGLMAAAAAVSEVRKKQRDAKSRGIAGSRPHGDYSDSSDSSDWEDASDDEDKLSDAESALAYGSVISHALRPRRNSGSTALAPAIGAIAGAAGVAAAARHHGGSSKPAESLPAVNSRKSSIVDPRLFGPVNSLRGMINTPCGFGEGASAVDHQQFNKLRRAETDPTFNRHTRDIYSSFDADSGAPVTPSRQDLPYRSRPAPIPLQQPSPKQPVSAKVYQAEKLEDNALGHAKVRSDAPGLSTDAKLGGIAAAAAAAVALAADRRSKRESRREERRKERKDAIPEFQGSERQSDIREPGQGRNSTQRRQDQGSEVSRRSQRDSYPSEYPDTHDHKRHSHPEEDDAPRKRRETKVDHYPGSDSLHRIRPSGSDGHHSYESHIQSQKDRRKFDTPSGQHKKERREPTVTQQQSADPFQFQVADGAYTASLMSAATAPARPLTPTVVTVDREPKFDDEPPRLAQSEPRLSRKDSFDIERMVEEHHRNAQDHPQGSTSQRNIYGQREREARNVYDVAKHATAPIAAVAIAAAAAAEMGRSSKQAAIDPVQEEADRYYRETVLAQRIAADEQRSRSGSPDKSLINKYDDAAQDIPSFTIVTPPDMEDQHSKESPYAGPDADVRIDNKIYPKELAKFRDFGPDRGLFTSRDPSCERERPLLNLVYPTPVPSPQPPSSLQQASSEIAEAPRAADYKYEDQRQQKPSTTNDDNVDDVPVEPLQSTVSSSAKSVTWGENETKSFEVETPSSQSDAAASQSKSEFGDKPRPHLDQASRWGMMAAAIAGSSHEAVNEPETKESRPKKKKKKKAGSDLGIGYREKSVDYDLMDDARSEPPVPGPKPVNTTSEPSSGPFDDDFEFAATLAAGLKDTGFDPNIVIDDPAYRRRDSPPHSSESRGDSWNNSSLADVVTDMTSRQKDVAEPGFFSGPVDETRDDPTGGTDKWTEAPKKLSKKEKKRLEKEAKRQSIDATEVPSVEKVETPAIEDAPERQVSKKGRKRLEKEAKGEPMEPSQSPPQLESPESAPFEDATESQVSKWEQRKRDKQARAEEKALDKSLDSKQDDSFWSAADADMEVLGKSKSKKSKKSRDFEDHDETSSKVSGRADSLPDHKSIRMVHPDDEWDTAKISKRQSATSSELGERESSNKRSSNSKRRSGNDFDENVPDPRDRKQDPWDDYDVSSVVSESRGDSRRKERRSKTSSSVYDDDDARSVVSLPGSTRRSRDKETEKTEKKSSGLFASIFKGKEDSKKSEKDSFLDNAGTLGEGVGLATATAAITAGLSRSIAAQASLFHDDQLQTSRELRNLDPEVAPRAFKPAIDPQYGDLLPLPPSEPGSPKSSPEDLPSLPESRPDTPPDERSLKRDLVSHHRRRSTQDTPTKSPSTTAIPISLRLGQRHNCPPSSPSAHRSPSNTSPAASPESSRRSTRISWDSSREFKPLYLLEHSRHGSLENASFQMDLPELPPSEPSESSFQASPAPEMEDLTVVEDMVNRNRSTGYTVDPRLSIDTNLAAAAPAHEIAGSQETTPKALTNPDFPSEPEHRADSLNLEDDPAPIDSMSKNRSSYLLSSTPSSTQSNRTVAGPPSPSGSTPTKSLAVENVLPDVTEDFTSADEHFLDALEGHQSETFEDVRDWPPNDQPSYEASQKNDVAETAIESESMPASEIVVESGPPFATPSEEPEPNEWKNMSAKQKKKAKKARKNNEQSLSETSIATATAAAATAVAASTFTKQPEEAQLVDSLAPPLADFEQPEKGKKGKMKKPLPSEENLEEAPKLGLPADDTVSVSVDNVFETASATDRSANVGNDAEAMKQEIDIPVAEEAHEAAIEMGLAPDATESSKGPIDATVIEPELELAANSAFDVSMEPQVDTTVIDDAETTDAWEVSDKRSSKKKKAKKAKNIASQNSEKLATEEHAGFEPVPVEQPPESLVKETPVNSIPEEPANDAVYTPEESQQTGARAVDSCIAAEQEMLAAPLSKKEKKKKKKKNKGVLLDEPTPSGNETELKAALEPYLSEDVKKEFVAVLDVHGAHSEQPALEFQEQIPEPAEDALAPASKGKEQKKKGARLDSSLALEDAEPPVNEAGQPSNPDEEPFSVSKDPAMPAEAEDADFVPVTKSKKKKKTKQIDSSFIETEPVPPAADGDKPDKEITPNTDDTSSATPELDEHAESQDATEGKDNEIVSVLKNGEEPLAESAQIDGSLQIDTHLDDAKATTDQPSVIEPHLTNEPTATPLAASDADFAPVAKGKKKKKKTKQLDASLSTETKLEDPTGMHEQLSKTILPDQPITEEPTPTEGPSIYASDSLEATATDFAPETSKNKKKKKSARSDDPSPVDMTTEDAMIPQQQQQTLELSSDLPTKTETSVAAPGQPAESTETDFAPIPKGKKKKKDKRKSVQWDDSLTPPSSESAPSAAMAEPTEDPEVLEHVPNDNEEIPQQTPALEFEVSEPLFSQGDAPLETTQSSTSVEPTQVDDTTANTAPTEEPWTELASSKKKGKKNKKTTGQTEVWNLLEENTADQEAIKSASASTQIEDDKTAEQDEAATTTFDTSSTAPIVEDVEHTEAPQDVQAEDEWSMSSSNKKSKRKKKGSFGTSSAQEAETGTEVPVDTIEPTPVIDEKPATKTPSGPPPATLDVETSTVPLELLAEDESSMLSLSKNSKKKKKGSKLLSIQESEPQSEPTMESPPEVVHSISVAEDPAAIANSESFPVAEDEDAEARHDATAEDAWSPPSSNKKSKKKKKGSKLETAIEPENNSVGPPTETVEPIPFSEEPAALETQPNEESERSIEEEWPLQATNKKSKKKKNNKQSLLAEPIDEASADKEAPLSSVTPPAVGIDVAAAVAEPEVELETPKKGKNKNKNKKASSTLTFLESDVQPDPNALDAGQVLVDDKKEIDSEIPSPKVDQVTAENQIAKLESPDDPMVADATQAIDKTPVETPKDLDTASVPAEELEFRSPARLSKKERKKKKKQATWEESTTASMPETITDSAVNDGQSASDPQSNLQPSQDKTATTENPGMIDETTTAAGTEGLEARPDDEWGGFSLKQSKKDKKKKNAKDVESEISQELEPTHETKGTTGLIHEPSPEDMDVIGHTSVNDSDPVATMEPNEPGGIEGSDKEARAGEPEAKFARADEQEEMVSGLVKGEEEALSENLQIGSMHSTSPGEMPAASEEIGTTKAEDTVDNTWTATMSKKDKKKKKNKKAKQASQYDDSPEQDSSIQDAENSPVADARPEAEHIDPLDPANTAQNTGDTGLSDDAAHRDVPIQSLQETCTVQELQQEPSEVPVAEGQALQDSSGVADSSAPTGTNQSMVIEDVSLEPSSDPAISVNADKATDNEWLPTSTKKKGKKGNNRKSQVDSMDWDEVQPGSSREPAVEDSSVAIANVAAELTESTPDVNVPTSREVELITELSGPGQAEPVDVFMGEEEPQNAPSTRDFPHNTSSRAADNELVEEQEDKAAVDQSSDSIPQRKLSKIKKKKNKKQSAISGKLSEPAKAVPETGSSLEERTELSAVIADESSIRSPIQEDITINAEDILSTKASKKDRKSAKAALAAVALAATITETEKEESTQLPLTHESAPAIKAEKYHDITAEEPAQVQGTSWADEMDDAVPIFPTESKGIVKDTPLAEPLLEDSISDYSHSIFNTKKGKKAKSKGKSIEYLSPSGPEETSIKSASFDATSQPAEQPAEPTMGKNLATVDAEDEWAMSSKKKGKKGKRGKLKTMSVDDYTPPQPVVETAEISKSTVEPAYDPSKAETSLKEAMAESSNDPDDAWVTSAMKESDEDKTSKLWTETSTPTRESIHSMQQPPESLAALGLEKQQDDIAPSIETAPEERNSGHSTKFDSPELVEAPQVTKEYSEPDVKSNSDKIERNNNAFSPTLTFKEPDNSAELIKSVLSTAQEPSAAVIDQKKPFSIFSETDEVHPAVASANDEFEWATTTKNMKAKGKKGKSSSESAVTTTPSATLADVGREEPPKPEEPAIVQDGANAALTSIPESVEPSYALHAESEWAAAEKKKKSKGKRTQFVPISFINDAQPAMDEGEINASQSRNVATMEVDASATEKEKHDTKDDAPLVVASEAAPTDIHLEPLTGDAVNDDTVQGFADQQRSNEPVPAASEANTNHGWDGSTKKKSKKEKRRKTSLADALDSLVTEPAQQDSPKLSTVEDLPQRATEDENIGDLSISEFKGECQVEKDTSKPHAEVTLYEHDTSTEKDSRTDSGLTGQDAHTESITLPEDVDKLTKKEKGDREALPAALKDSAIASANAGGIAVLTEKFGGSKKKKAKGKQKKILDKRQPQEDDLFDDPALWEGADKKALDDGKDNELHESFWGGGEEELTQEGQKLRLGATDNKEAESALPTPASEGRAKSDAEWKETARQGVTLEDEYAENPARLHQGEPLDSQEPAGLLRRTSGIGEPVGGLLKEQTGEEPIISAPWSTEPDFRRSPTRGLPAVEENPEAEAAAAKYNWPTPETNRDSGFAPASPDLQRRHSRTFEDAQPRDSGVHTTDYREGKFDHTPVSSSGKRARHTLLATAVLREPDEPPTTPEPEKKRNRETAKSYGEVGSDLGTTATDGPGTMVGDEPRSKRRSVSDNTPATSIPSSTKGAIGSAWSASGGGLGLALDPSPRAEPGAARRSASSSSLSRFSRQQTPEALRMRPESPGTSPHLVRSTPTPPLRRIDKRMSGDLRALRQQRSSTPTQSGQPSQTPTTPVANEGRVRSKGEASDMADVYDGYGEGRIGSPRSPTRPHSMRRRQSMQVLELESRVEQLMAENRLLTEARANAEQNLSHKAVSILSERDSEIESLKQSLHFLQNEVARLTEVNDGLASANAELASKDNGRFTEMTRDLDEARGTHTMLTQSLQDKDAEIADLRAQLEEAKEQIRQMQRKILESKAGNSEFLDIKDEDYFDHRCQQLCSHVQQWVLRFSKFSDMRACRLTNEINDEKTIDRLDNAVLDGSDVDRYLRDRIKRRDIFMSMTMSMTWEFVFTRYLFGMDREQRQKLKSLEKLLMEVGPAEAVRQWRAVTLTLLSRRDSFKDQRDLDTEAVVQAIFQTLCQILPPPSNLENQIQSQLRRVMREAVDLSIEMRTQRAEYMMLPPLQPEYDADGELAATVSFDAAMMNERSGQAKLTNEELEAQGAVVRIVLFPLVVKRGDDSGVGEDKIVVCPAQVLVVRDDNNRRHFTPSEAGGASLGGAPSHLSLATESMGQPEAQYMEGGL